MAEGYTDFILNKVQDSILQADAFSLANANFYFALFDNGTEVDTGVWTNYARVSVVRNATNFPNSANGDSANGAIIDFGTAAVTGGPEHVDEIRMYDDPTAGNLCWQAALNVEKDINDGDPVTVPVGDLDLTFTQT